MEKIKLSKRLCKVASFVEKGKRVLDVGTDHAYIPIFLLQNGICDFAAGSDINRGPLEAAHKNADEYGVSDNLSLYLSDGLKNTDCCKNMFDCIVICGMGGEMIVSILSDSDYVKKPDVTLILQPMTMQDVLRGYLSENGFEITDETVIYDKKPYQIIVCCYTGKKYKLTETEKFFGKINLSRINTNPDAFSYARFVIEMMEKISAGKKIGNEDASHEEEIINTLTKLTEE